MKYNRKTFWASYKQLINRQVTTRQIQAVEFLLDNFEADPIWSDLRHVAYALATVHHETAFTYEPIQEFGSYAYFERRYGHQTRKGRELGNDAPGEGAKYSGKGYVQLTGESNYEKLEEIIKKQNPEIVRAFEARTGQRFDLTDYAYQAKDPHIAFLIMTIGMFRGIYTGVAFRHYINERETNYKEARRIINGTDKQNQIAAVAVDFEKILRASRMTENFTNLKESEIDILEIPNPVPNAPELIPPVPVVSEQDAGRVLEQNNATAAPIGQQPENVAQTDQAINTDTFVQYIPQIGKARAWLGGLSAVGLFSTVGAKLADMPDWLVFLLGFLTGIAFSGLVFLIVSYYRQVFALVQTVVRLNANPQMNNLKLTAEKPPSINKQGIVKKILNL